MVTDALTIQTKKATYQPLHYHARILLCWHKRLADKVTEQLAGKVESKWIQAVAILTRLLQ